MNTTIKIITLLFALTVALTGCDSSTSKIPEEKLQSSGDFDTPTGQVDEQGKPIVNKVADVLVVDAGKQQFSDPNLLVKLRGSVARKSDEVAPAVFAQWTQIEGPAAFIVSPDQLETLILAPDVQERTKLTFQLRGRNELGTESWDTTSLYVYPSEDNGRLVYVVSSIVDEEANVVVFEVKLRSPAQEQITFDYDTEGEGAFISATALQNLDYVPQSGSITFAPGEIRKEIRITLLGDTNGEGNEFFNLFLKDPQTGRTIINGVAIVKDDEAQPIFPTTVPVDEGPSDQTQEQVGGTPGVVRGVLEWDNPNTQLDLILRFTGEDGECDIRISSTQEQAECDDRLGVFESSPNRSEIIWPSAAPAGFYRFIVQHTSGQVADYNLRLFIDDESLRFSGTIAAGASVEVYSFDFEGAVSETSSSAESSESSSEISSASSSPESSSSSESSSTSQSSEAPSSSVPSSSSQSSTSSIQSSETSSQGSSSSELKPELDLAVQFDGIEDTYISVPVVLIGGSFAYDPVFPVQEVAVVVSFGNDEIPSFEIPLNTGEWDLDTGDIAAEVGFSLATESSQEFSLSLIARDSAGRSAVSQTVSQLTYLNAPSISLTLPEERSYFGGQVEIRGQVAVDPLSPTSDVIIYLIRDSEDSPQELPVGVEGGEFFWFLPESLTHGSYTVWATVSDASGQSVSSNVVAFDYAEAGAINVVIDQPEDSLIGLYPGATEAVSGSVDQSAGLDIATATVSIRRLVDEVGGMELVSGFSLLDSDFWNAETQAFNFLLNPQSDELDEGFYNLFINATDVVGNAGDASFSFEYFVPSQPSLLVELPANTTYLLSVPVRAEATFDSRLQASLSGEISSNGEVLETLSVPLAENSVVDMQVDTLNPGAYSLSLTLLDSAGQESVVENLSFSVRAPVEPSLVIESPEIGEEPPVVLDGRLVISGSFDLDSETQATSLDLQIFDMSSEPSLVADVDLQALGAWNADENTFNYTLVMADHGILEGAYTAEVVVEDSFGGSASDSVEFEYRIPVEPQIEWITQPQERNPDVTAIEYFAYLSWDSALTATATAFWTRTFGETADSGSELLSVDAEGTATGRFSAPVEPGNYTLYIQVQDSMGRTARTSESNFEVYEAEGPVISLSAPEIIEGLFSTVRPSALIQGSVVTSSETNISELALIVSAGESILMNEIISESEGFNAETGEFSALIDGRALLDGYGLLDIQLIAEDSLGLSDEVTFQMDFVQAEETFIEFLEPLNGASYFSAPTVSGQFRVDDRLNVARLEVGYLINTEGGVTRVPVSSSYEGISFSASLEGIAPGSHTIYAFVEDDIGQSSTVNLSFEILPVEDLAIDWVDPIPEETPEATLGPVLDLTGQVRISSVQLLDLEVFPNGSSIPTNQVLTDQYRDIGVLINARRPEQPDGSLNAIAAGPSGGRYFFFSPDTSGAIATFEFVVPGTNTPTNSNLFRVHAGWQAGETITLVAFNQDGQLVATQSYSSPATGSTMVPGVIEFVGEFHRIEIQTNGNPGIGLSNIEFDIGVLPNVPEGYLDQITQSVELEVVALDGETSVIDLFDLNGFDTTTGVLNYSLNFVDEAMLAGIYDLSFVATTEFGEYRSDVLRVEYVDAPAPELNLTSPVTSVYFSGVEISGSVTASEQLNLTAFASLQPLDGESSANDVSVTVQDGLLSGVISSEQLNTGSYLLEVYIEDQFGRPSDVHSVQFDFVAPQASIEIFPQGQAINTLFSTGVDNQGIPLEPGAVDTHYFILDTESNAVTLTSPYSGYMPNDLDSQWIWENANGQPINVTRTFRTTFELTDQDPATAVIYGRWAMDNYGLDILINGVSTGFTAPGYTEFTDFEIRSGFVEGTNTLDFVIDDVGGVSSFRVQLSGTASSFNEQGVLEVIEAFSLNANIQLSHPQLPVDNFVLEVLQDDVWVQVQTFSPDEVTFSGTGATFELDYSQLGFGIYESRIRMNYGPGLSTISDTLTVTFRETQEPSVAWLNPPQDFYLTPEIISFSADAFIDDALTISEARAVIRDASSEEEVYVLTDFGTEGLSYYGSTSELQQALAAGDYLWTFEIVDSFGRAATSESILVQIREPDNLILVLQSPLLEEGVINSVIPELNISGDVMHDENTSLASLELNIYFGSNNEGSLVNAIDLINTGAFDPESGSFDYLFSANDFGEGNYYVELQASDALGNGASLNFNYVYTVAQEPSLQITSPLSERYFELPRLEGNYTVEPELLINTFTATLLYSIDEEIPATAELNLTYSDGEFYAELPQDLSPGIYSILVNLEDQLGGRDSATVNFEFYIPSATTVELLQPVSGESDFFTINPTISFSGELSVDQYASLEQIQAVLITGDGQELTQDIALDTIGSVEGSAFEFNGEWNLQDLDLSSGLYELLVRVSTDIDSVTSNSLFVEFLSVIEPTLEVIAPVSNQVYFLDIPISATASFDANASANVIARYRVIGSTDWSPVVDISLDGEVVTGSIPVSGLLPGDYELGIYLEDSFDQSPQEQVIPFNYSVPTASVELIHTHPESDGVVDLIDTLFVEAQITLQDPDLAINSLSVQVLGEGGWFTLDTYENLAVLNWDGSSANVNFDFASHEFGYGIYDWRVQINYANNLLASSDALRVNYRELQALDIQLFSPEETTYFDPVAIEGQVNSDPLLDYQITAILYDRNSESEGQTLNFERDGDSFGGVTISEYGDYYLEVSARYTNTDRGAQTQALSFSLINPQVNIALGHQMPVFDGVIDGVDPLFLIADVELSDSSIPVDGFAVEILQGDNWVDLQTFTEDQADFGGSQAYFNVDLYQLGIAYGVYEIRARVDFAQTRSAVSNVLTVNYRELEDFVVDIVSPQNGEASETPFVLSVQYVTDRLATPVQLFGQVQNQHEADPISLSTLPEFDQSAGQFSFAIPSESLRWGQNQITIDGVDGRNRTSNASTVTVNYSLSVPQVEIVNVLPDFESAISNNFALQFSYQLDEKLPAPLDEESPLFSVFINDVEIERSVSVVEGSVLQVNFLASDFQEGDQTVAITVADPRDTSVVGSAEFSFAFNHQPTIRIFSPLSAEIQDQPYYTDVNVDFDTSIRSGGVVATYDAYVNGESYELDQPINSGVNSFIIPANILISGEENELVIQAFSENGVASEITPVVFNYYRPTAPDVSIQVPQPDEPGSFYQTFNPDLVFSGDFTFDPTLGLPAVNAYLLSAEDDSILDQIDLIAEGGVEFDPSSGQGGFGGAFELDAENLGGGEYILQLRVADSVTNPATDEVLINYQVAVEPSVEILSPVQNELFDTDFFVEAIIDWQRPLDVTIEATITQQDSAEPISFDVDLEPSEGNSFFANVPSDNLVSGSYELFLSVEDSLDQSAEASVTFTYSEPEPLIVEIEQPTQVDGIFSTVGPRILVSGTIYFDTDRPLQEVGLSFINTDPNNPTDLSQSILENLVLSEGSANFSVEINLNSLEAESGSYQLMVNALDELRRESQDIVNVNYRIPEQSSVNILSPIASDINERTYSGEVYVEARVSTDPEVEIETIYGEVYTGENTNPERFAISAQSTEGGVLYVALLNEEQLAAGNNRIRVVVEDSVEETVRDEVNIVYRNIDPTTITVVSGQNSSADFEAEIDFSFDPVNSPATITRVITSGQIGESTTDEITNTDQPGTHYDYLYGDDLYIGENTIEYIIEDAAGTRVIANPPSAHFLIADAPWMNFGQFSSADFIFGQAFTLPLFVYFDAGMPFVETSNGISASLTINNGVTRNVVLQPTTTNNQFALVVQPDWVSAGLNEFSVEVCDPRLEENEVNCVTRTTEFELDAGLNFVMSSPNGEIAYHQFDLPIFSGYVYSEITDLSYPFDSVLMYELDENGGRLNQNPVDLTNCFANGGCAANTDGLQGLEIREIEWRALATVGTYPFSFVYESLKSPINFINQPGSREYVTAVPVDGFLEVWDYRAGNAIVKAQIIGDGGPIGTPLEWEIPGNQGFQYSFTIPRTAFPSWGDYQLDIWVESEDYPEYRSAVESRSFRLLSQNLQLVHLTPEDGGSYQDSTPFIRGYLRDADTGQQVNFDYIRIYRLNEDGTRFIDESYRDITNCYTTDGGCELPARLLDSINYREIEWSARGVQGSYTFKFEYVSYEEATLLVLSPLPNSRFFGDVDVVGRFNTWDERAGSPVIHAQVYQNGQRVGEEYTRSANLGDQWDITIPFDAFENGWGAYSVRIWARSEENPSYVSATYQQSFELIAPEVVLDLPTNQTYSHIVPVEGFISNWDSTVVTQANVYVQPMNGNEPIGSPTFRRVTAGNQFSFEINRDRFPGAGRFSVAVWAVGINTPNYRTAEVTRSFSIQQLDDIAIRLNQSSLAEFPLKLSSDDHQHWVDGVYTFDKRYPVRLLVHKERPGYKSTYNGTPHLADDGTFRTIISMGNNGNISSGTYDVWVEIKEDVAGGRSATTRVVQVDYTNFNEQVP